MRDPGQTNSQHAIDRVEEATRRNVEIISRSEQQARARRSLSERISDGITAFCGSIPFVWLHVLWYGGWIVANIYLPESRCWDPFPFAVLTLIASSEAIFVSTFVLISQNRQAKLNERRDHLNLQVNLLAEQETTKMLKLLRRIGERVGVEEICHDSEVKAYEETTCPEKLLSQIDQTIADTEQRLK